jgi:hypothetical protein
VAPIAQHIAEAHGQESPEAAPSATFVLRNIPARCTIDDILQLIQDSGFRGTWDFLFMPLKANGRRNKGLVFVNFLDPRQALIFQCVVDNASFDSRPSPKKVVVEVATSGLSKEELQMSVVRTFCGQIGVR